MRIKDFVQKEYTDFVNKETGISNLTAGTLWRWYKAHILWVQSPQLDGFFETRKEFLSYDLRQGDKVTLAGKITVHGRAEYLTLAKVGKVSGVGPKLLSNIDEIMGNTFTVKQLRENAGSISGLGAATLEAIKES
jgi:exonuclease VII large subunit